MICSYEGGGGFGHSLRLGRIGGYYTYLARLSDARLRLKLLLSVLIHWEGSDTDVTVPKSGRQDVVLAASRVSA